MVILLVATTTDFASINPTNALLAMHGWTPGPSLQGIKSFANQQVRLLQHDKGIVEEGHRDVRWEEATGEAVEELIFFSKRTAVPNCPALTVHPAYGPHVSTGKVQGKEKSRCGLRRHIQEFVERIPGWVCCTTLLSPIIWFLSLRLPWRALIIDRRPTTSWQRL